MVVVQPPWCNPGGADASPPGLMMRVGRLALGPVGEVMSPWPRRLREEQGSVQGHTVQETSGCAGGSFCSLVNQGGPGPLQAHRDRACVRKEDQKPLARPAAVDPTLLPAILPSLLAGE